MTVHWKSKARCENFDGTTEIATGAACMGFKNTPHLKLGVKDAVTCKRCIRRRESMLKRKAKSGTDSAK